MSDSALLAPRDRICPACRTEGVCGSCDAIVVAPPLIISETDIWELVTRLREALLDVSVDLNEARPPHGFPRGGGATLGVSGEESSSAVPVRVSKSRKEE